MACSAGALSNHDVPDTVMALLLIAMDPSSSPDLKRDIMMAVDTICQSIKEDSGAAPSTASLRSVILGAYVLIVALSGTGIVQKSPPIRGPTHTNQQSPIYLVLVRRLWSNCSNRKVAGTQAPCCPRGVFNSALRSMIITNLY
jgi:hypothetical protein